MADDRALTSRDGAARRVVRALPLVLLPAAILLQWGASLNPVLVERVYARGVYPVLVRGLVTLTAWLPFSLAELLLGAAIVWIVVRLVRTGVAVVKRRRPLTKVLISGGRGLLAVCGLLYLIGLVLWGFNYQRQPLAERAGFDTSPVAQSELESLGRDLVVSVNELRGLMAEDGSGVMRLSGTPRKALERASRGYEALAEHEPELVIHVRGRAKAVFSPILLYLQTGGVYAPFTAEPNVSIAIPACELPLVICHEMAHQAGLASEDEANFIGYLACSMHPDADFRYSGTLVALRYVLSALRRTDTSVHERLWEACDEGVRRDWQASWIFWQRFEGKASRLSSQVYDTYLKSQGQEGGIASYGRMVNLLVARDRIDRLRRAR